MAEHHEEPCQHQEETNIYRVIAKIHKRPSAVRSLFTLFITLLSSLDPYKISQSPECGLMERPGRGSGYKFFHSVS